jgi:hypothetical protein
MIKLWNHVLKPILSAAEARTILEVGAEFGRSTNTLLKFVKQNNGHLHSIDPVPAFDAAALVEENRDHLSIYEDLSLNVIPSLPQCDAALVDGDHNWYTVHSELHAIEVLHGSDPMKLPVILAHDTGWPYGRRDLYYDPSNIPEDMRQPYAKAGILPRQSNLQPSEGLNVNLCNAVHDGGDRNGVRTGLEDYVSESSLNIRIIHLPLYYGLTILVTHERLASDKKLSNAIDELLSAEGMRGLLHRLEEIRCVDAIYLQSAMRRLKAAQDRIEQLEGQLANGD